MKINNKRHVIMKKLDKENIAKKITSRFFQVSIYYIRFLFKSYLHNEIKKVTFNK